LISNEKTILVNFYNSLTSKGTLAWNTGDELCGQDGIFCDISNERLVKLYFFLLYKFNFKFRFQI